MFYMNKSNLAISELKIIALLTDSSDDIELPDVLPVNFIVENKLCLFLYQNYRDVFERKYDNEELASIWRKAENMHYTLDELKAVSSKFEEHSIDYLYLFKAIESQCDSTDVDIVIGNGDFDKTCAALEEIGYFRPLYPYEDDHFVRSEKGYVAQLDIRTEKDNILSHYLFDEKNKDQFLNRRRVNGLYVPSVEDELITCVNRTLDKKEIPLLTLVHIAKLMESCISVSAVTTRVSKHWVSPFLQTLFIMNKIHQQIFGIEINSPLVHVAKKTYNESKILKILFGRDGYKINFPFKVKSFYHYWSISIYINDLKSGKMTDVLRRLFSILLLGRNYLRLISCARKKSLMISFSGIDGTGKSSNSEKMLKRFKDMRIPSGKALGLWSPKISYPLMGFLFVTIGWRRKDYRKSTILRKYWNYIVILDYIYIYMRRVWPQRLIGKTVFMDKYTFDLITMLIHDGLYSEKPSNLLIKAVPKPDITFIFDIPEDVSTERKDDTQEWLDKLRIDQDLMEFLKIKREGYIKIANSLDLPLIDSTRDFDEVHEELFQQVLVRYRLEN